MAGPGEDLSAFAPHRTVSGAPLGEVVRVLRDAAFFAGNDSGTAHLAAAFGVPQIVILGPSDAEVWAALRTPAEILKSDGAIGDISVERVVQAVDRLKAAA